MSAGSVAAPRPAPRSVRRGRLSIGRLLLVIALVVVVLLAGAVVIVLTRTPPVKKADCGAGQQCGNPPPGKPLVNGELWTSSGLGYQFEYDASLWEVTNEDSDGVTLEVPRGGVAVIFTGASTAEEEPTAAFDRVVSGLGEQLALATDPDPAHQIAGPKVGDFHADASGVFQGSTSVGQGRVLQVRVLVMSASDGDTTITVALVSPENNLAPASQDVDGMLNTLRYPSETDV